MSRAARPGADDRRRPVIVGVGESAGNRQRDPDAAHEPLSLILDAAAAAIDDTGAAPGTLAGTVDAAYAVRTTSWAYDRAASRVAAALGASPRHTVDTTVGGQWPVALLERAASCIAAGESEVALLVGGEAQASLQALYRAGRDPVADAGWSRQPGGPPSFDPAELGSPRMQASGVMLPIRVYPLFHNAMQAARRIDPQRARRHSATLYAGFTQVAAAHPFAWNPQVRTADDLATVTPHNRMVCEPYPLALNAMPQVDQAAAVVVTSAAAARRLGIPEDRWVHVWGGAGANDSVDVLDRRTYARSDALGLALDTALHRSGASPGSLDLVDAYSCFPVVPELLAAHLGLSDTVALSATGGHNAFGGPLNSYSLHAIAAVSRRIRAGVRLALVHANGGYMTHQHVTLLSATAHDDGYLGDPEPRRVAAAPPIVRDAAHLVPGEHGGVPVTIETFTVEHGRDGRPAQAFVIARTDDGERLAAATPPGDLAAAASLSFATLPPGAISHIGRRVLLRPGPGGPWIDPHVPGRGD